MKEWGHSSHTLSPLMGGERMKEWTLRHGLRLAGVVTAVAPALVSVLDSLPWQWAVGLSAVVLSASEGAQRLLRIVAPIPTGRHRRP